MIIQLLNFNNYYNRILKRMDGPFSQQDEEFIAEYNNINFNPNDGVNTTLVINTPAADPREPNYMLLMNEEYDIVSKWFIIEAIRTRLNQYEITLRRDLFSDFYNEIVNAPVFIEKATVGFGNPLLFNSEDMTFNQIKTREIKIGDKMDCAWIVGYINKDQGAATITTTLDRNYVAEYPSMSALPLYNRLTADNSFNCLNTSSVSLQLRYMPKGVSDRYAKQNLGFVDFNQNGYIASGRTGSGVNEIDWSNLQSTVYREDWVWEKGKNLNNAAAPIAREAGSFYAARQQAFLQAIYEQTLLGTPEEEAEFLATYPASGMIVKVGNSYKKITRVSAGSQYLYIRPNLNTSLLNLFTEMAESNSQLEIVPKTGNGQTEGYRVNCYQTTYRLIIEDVAVPRDTYSFSIPSAENRTHLNDAPYDMFAIPYSPEGYRRYMTIPVGDSGEQIPINSDAGMAIAQKITNQLTDQKVYDLQLLPYCPIQEALYERGINLYANTTLEKDVDFSIITNSNSQPQSVVLWCSSSSFSFTKEYNIPVLEPKIEAMCDFYRLVSPNYSGQFEFNHVKNEGVEFFQIDATYKPYSPYIRVAPNFKGLYGGQFGDARGLICGGDFSLPTTTDQWKQYEINNKNYLNTFNRQIENMEVNNKYQRQSEIVGAVAGTLQGGTTGASAGMIAGGPTGAAIGAGVGFATSAIGGIADVNINEKLRSEALDYTRDQFGYALGNIQALPYTLNRVSSFNINNKVFPILEYYTCTDIEKQALRDKITYNGMTVMKIGTINDYIQPEPSYIKGRLIRLEGFDSHTTIEIANELNKGYYI